MTELWESSPDSPYVIDNVGKYTEELALLLSISRERRYYPNDVIYLQGEKSRCFYFVKRGRIKVSIYREDGSEKILAIQEGNTFFGESAAFDRYPYFATATVLDESEINVIDIRDAENLIRKHPQVSFMVIAAIIRKLRLLGLQVEDLSFLDAQRRVAHILIKLAGEIGEEAPGGITISKQITHEDIANLTGLSRVTVTNMLNYLERLNILKKGRRCLTILNRDRLASFLEDAGQ